MRPVKDRWTWPARTPPVSARPPRRDVARAGVAHANTGPAARGCRPRTDGLRGSIRRRDRSSRGSPKRGRSAEPSSLRRATWRTAHAPIGNRPHEPTIACRSCAVSDGLKSLAEPSTSGAVHHTHRYRAGCSMVMREERDGSGFDLRSPKNRRSADFHGACDQ